MSRRYEEHPFLLEVGDLRRNPGSHRRVQLEGSLPGLEVSGSAVPPEAVVQINALLEAVHDGILVTGTVRGPWRGACRRCLGEATGELEVAVRELCVDYGDEETTYLLSGDQLDLEPIVHDACILELPLAPLCHEGCLGLCPECGADRNVEPCACVSELDPRWAGLGALAGGKSAGASSATSRPEQGRG